tara:strand:- start:2999 stop:3652 length:654 start_codon:yes stop_codon:yes gene_type:complete
MTFTSHVALFPTAAASTRVNALTGVTPHNPAQKLIEGLAAGVANTILATKWNGLITGAADPPGTASPIQFTFPAAPAAAAKFLAVSGWVGPSSALFAESVIQNMILNVASMGILQGDTSLTVGTGSGTFPDPSFTAATQAALEASLMSTLPAGLMATGVFGQGDVPGSPINAKLASSIPYYAAAYALGLATLTATVPYIGTGATASAAAGVVTGSVL